MKLSHRVKFYRVIGFSKRIDPANPVDALLAPCWHPVGIFGKGGNIVSEANNEYHLLAAMPSRHRYYGSGQGFLKEIARRVNSPSTGLTGSQRG